MYTELTTALYYTVAQMNQVAQLGNDLNMLDFTPYTYTIATGFVLYVFSISVIAKVESILIRFRVRLRNW